MREAIGGSWLFGLVITFIMFFASFLALSINYAKAFNVKNDVVDLISKYEGNNCKARCAIKEHLSDVGYLVPGKCASGFTGYDLNGNRIYGNSKAYFCIKAQDTGTSTSIKKSFYRAQIFFKVDLPVIGDLLTLKINGDTEYIFFATDEINNCSCS